MVLFFNVLCICCSHTDWFGWRRKGQCCTWGRQQAADDRPLWHRLTITTGKLRLRQQRQGTVYTSSLAPGETDAGCTQEEPVVALWHMPWRNRVTEEEGDNCVFCDRCLSWLHYRCTKPKMTKPPASTYWFCCKCKTWDVTYVFNLNVFFFSGFSLKL